MGDQGLLVPGPVPPLGPPASVTPRPHRGADAAARAAPAVPSAYARHPRPPRPRP